MFSLSIRTKESSSRVVDTALALALFTPLSRLNPPNQPDENSPSTPEQWALLGYLFSLKPEARRNGFQEIFSKYRDREIRYLKSRFRGMPVETLADAVTDAFLELWKAVSREERDDKWTWAYLRGIAWHNVNHAYRRLRRERNFFSNGISQTCDAKGRSLEFAASEQRDPIELAAHNPEIREFEKCDDLMATVWRVIDKLPERQKKVALLIAANFDCSLGPFDICLLYFTAYHERISDKAAKGALSAIRKKLKKARTCDGRQGSAS